jgi:hypothetical protein
MPPSGQLIPTFKALIKDFNAANTVGDYRNFEQYLYPTPNVLIQKVDDPGKYKSGSRDVIIRYLNTNEAVTGKFPQAFYVDASLHDIIYQSHDHTQLFGTVAGTGTYQDDIRVVPPVTIPVIYCLRFQQYTDGNWLLVTANVAPIPPLILVTAPQQKCP